MKRLFELLKTLMHGGDDRTAWERYLAQSVDAQDLEVRLQAVEREHPDSVIDSHGDDAADSTYVRHRDGIDEVHGRRQHQQPQ